MSDDPFIDDRKHHLRGIIEGNQFVLKDGHSLHLVKVVGAIVHYHEYWNNDVTEIEDGTGKIQVVLSCCQNLECSGVKELHRKCAINTYVHLIGMVKDDFNLRTIVASDIRPVSTGNELTHHLLEVAYSADKAMTKQMEEKLDAELMSVDLNHNICEYQSRFIDFHNDNDDNDLNDTELNSLITEHMKDIANEPGGTVGYPA